jgi:hypothetical protein
VATVRTRIAAMLQRISPKTTFTTSAVVTGATIPCITSPMLWRVLKVGSMVGHIVTEAVCEPISV